MKTPISYYGGKQMMLKHIIPLIPNHKVYTEPFVGGGAVFFAKEPAKVEIINDLNENLVNFCHVLHDDYDGLYELIKKTIHSRVTHKVAWTMYQYPILFTPTHRAWAVWCLSKQGFSAQLDSSWGYDKTSNSTCTAIKNAKIMLKEHYQERLEHVQIESNDAVKIIESRDTEDTFHYCDPPYYNSNCGHYEGYTQEDFERLLTTLSNMKGKFMLSSYDSEVLQQYSDRFGWYQQRFVKNVAVSQRKGKKIKVEVITTNYPI